MIELADAIGAALLDLRRQHGTRLRAAARRAIEWLRVVGAPPAGLELRPSDDASYTGLVILDRNRPVLMLAFRQSATRRDGRPGGPSSTSAFRQTRFYEDGPYWDRDFDPPAR